MVTSSAVDPRLQRIAAAIDADLPLQELEPAAFVDLPIRHGWGVSAATGARPEPVVWEGYSAAIALIAPQQRFHPFEFLHGIGEQIFLLKGRQLHRIHLRLRPGWFDSRPNDPPGHDATERFKLLLQSASDGRPGNGFKEFSAGRQAGAEGRGAVAVEQPCRIRQPTGLTARDRTCRSPEKICRP